jgi:hypothetical protein
VEVSAGVQLCPQLKWQLRPQLKQLPELDQVGAGVDLNQRVSFCCGKVLCVDLRIIKLKIMKYKLIMGKDRFTPLQERMSDKVFFTRDEIEDDGTHWVHFEIEIFDQFDLLDLFHAGYHAGYDYRAKRFPI